MDTMIFGQENGQSAVDLALETGALFDVRRDPVTLPDGTIPTVQSGKYRGQPQYVTLWRERGDKPPVLLNVVPPQHPDSNYLQAIETSEALFPASTSGMRVLGHGKRLIWSQEIDTSHDLGGGDTIRPHLLWTASLDGSWATGCYGLASRAFCTNQIPFGNVHLSVKRTINHDVRLSVRAHLLAGAGEATARLRERVSALRHIPVSRSQFGTIVNALLPEPEPKKTGAKVHGKAKAVWERRVQAMWFHWDEEQDGPAAGTGWAAWNAVQSAESHDFTKSRSVETAVKRQVDQVRGNDLPVTYEAEERLLALA